MKYNIFAKALRSAERQTTAVLTTRCTSRLETLRKRLNTNFLEIKRLQARRHRLAKRHRVKKRQLVDEETVELQTPKFSLGTPITINHNGDFRCFFVVKTLKDKKVIASRFNHRTGLIEVVILSFRPLQMRKNRTLFGLWIPDSLSCRQAHRQRIDVYPHYMIDSHVV